MVNGPDEERGLWTMRFDTLWGTYTASRLSDGAMAKHLREVPHQPGTDDIGSAGSSSGSRSAMDIGAIYDEHFDYVQRCLRNLGVPAATVDDATQDTFVVVHHRLSEFDGACQLRTWLYAIVIRIARKYRARDKRVVGVSVDDTEGDGCTERAVAHAEQLQIARQILATLDDAKREVFVLADIEQRSAREIAAIIGIPVNTVYSRLRVARAEFNLRAERALRSKRGTE